MGSPDPHLPISPHISPYLEPRWGVRIRAFKLALSSRRVLSCIPLYSLYSAAFVVYMVSRALHSISVHAAGAPTVTRRPSCTASSLLVFTAAL